MFQKFTSDSEIISMYNDYVFLKMNLEMYIIELSEMVLKYNKNKGLEELYHIVSNDGICSNIDLISEMIDELSDNEVKIIISIFNPVIFENFKRISLENHLDLICFNQRIPIINKSFLRTLKSQIKNSF